MLPNLCSLRLTYCGIVYMGSIEADEIDLPYKDLYKGIALGARLQAVAAVIKTWNTHADMRIREDADMPTELEC